MSPAIGLAGGYEGDDHESEGMLHVVTNGCFPLVELLLNSRFGFLRGRQLAAQSVGTKCSQQNGQRG